MEDEYWALFPKEYNNALNLLKKSFIKNHHNIQKKHNLYQNFCEKYTTLPGTWKSWTHLIRWTMYDDVESNYLHKSGKEIEESSLKHFPMQDIREWPYFDRQHFYDDKKTFQDKLDYTEFMLSFPHSQLSLALTNFKELSTNSKALPKNMEEYYKNLELYKEISSTDIKDGYKFVQVLKKSDSDEFVIKNLECQLTENPWCQNLWLSYIKYLETDKKDDKALLKLLSRYCRLFISDKKIKEKYLKKVKEMSQNLEGISEFWIDSIKFELQFNGKNSATNLMQKALETKIKDISKFFNDALDFAKKYRLNDIEIKIRDAKKQYSLENNSLLMYDCKTLAKNASIEKYLPQNLPFGNSVNYYILQNFDYQHLRKLYQTCKWFFYKFRFNLIHKLQISEEYYAPFNESMVGIPYINFMDHSISFSACKIETINLKNIWLTNSFHVSGYKKISNIFQKISKVTIKYLKVSGVFLTEKEFKILTKSKTVVSLFLHTKIKCENDEMVLVEEILQNVPNARQITINPAYQTPETAENLLSLKFQNKFDVLDLNFQPLQINPGLYYEFLENNLNAKARVALYCIVGEIEYENAMENYFSKWNPKNEKPFLEWSSRNL